MIRNNQINDFLGIFKYIEFKINSFCR